jgi:hypothetical protein
MVAGIFGHGEHDRAERSAHVLDGASHGAAVEVDAVGTELLFLAEVRHAEAELLQDEACEHAGCEQPAAKEQPRQRRGDDGRTSPLWLGRRYGGGGDRRIVSGGRAHLCRRGSVRCGRISTERVDLCRRSNFWRRERGVGYAPLHRRGNVWSGRKGNRLRTGLLDLVLGSRHHDAHWLGPLIAEQVASFPADERAGALELGVANFDASLAPVVGLCEISAALRWALGLDRRLAGRARTDVVTGSGARRGRLTRSGFARARDDDLLAGSELIELLLRLGELELELGSVDTLGLGDEDPPPQELELLHELAIGAPQLVALQEDPCELVARLGELALHAAHQRFECSYACR